MADTTTPLLGMLLMGTGGDNNSWGQNLNDQVISRLDNIIAGVRQVTVNANPYTLSAADLGYNTLSLTGAITADQVIIIPDLQRRFKFTNNLTGAFFCLLQTTAAANKVNLPFQKTVGVIVPGNTFVAREDGYQVGELFYHAGIVPPGAFECNNAAFKRASAVDLFNSIGTLWGFNDGTDFKVPPGTDTGRFLRSRTGAVPAGTSQSNQNAAHTHALTGAPGVGTLSTDVQGSHTHTANVTDPCHLHIERFPQPGGGATWNESVTGNTTATLTSDFGSGTNINTQTAVTGISVNNVAAGSHSHNVTGAPTVGTLATVSSGGTEARPESVVGVLCIRY
jgi:hypothetical protein